MCHVVMWWLSTVVCHLISVTFKYFVALWLLSTGLFMLHHLRAEFRISLKNVCRLFLKDWIIQGGLFGGCLGCLPCNSCQPSVERIASSLPSFQFCLFVLSPFSQQSEQSFYVNLGTFYFVLFPSVLWVLKWLGSTCDFWHLGLYEK